MSVLGRLRTLAFGIPSERDVFSGPGFAKESWERFQPVAHSLVAGYHATLEDSRIERLTQRLDEIEPELQGFAYEGAAMGLAALDCIAPWKRRLQAFVEGPGARHIYPIYVGVGLALARLRRRPEMILGRLDPVLCWVVVDGYGFHKAFFSYVCSVERQEVPGHLSRYGRRLFDQGMGRAIWFSGGAVLENVTPRIARFPAARQADLWSGVGLACAYAGGLNRAGLVELRDAAGPYRPMLARGAAVAASGRRLAGNEAPHTELACQVFCGVSAAAAAEIIDRARAQLPAGGSEPAYEVWRRRTDAQLALQVS